MAAETRDSCDNLLRRQRHATRHQHSTMVHRAPARVDGGPVGTRL